MFLDSSKVFIKSGKGGDGCLSFHRAKSKPRGGPDGGDGGDGGSVVFIGDANVNTLYQFKYERRLIAKNGLPGKGINRSGKKGKDLKIRVPCGTVIKDLNSNKIICEILEPDMQVVIAEGGIGGRGNQHFATPTNQIPRHFEYGKSGVEFDALLELKMIADVGLLGFPNAGKSSLITAMSNARPKIADYPFTTLTPNLGVVALPSYKTMVLADIPGIIEGASQGKGLGLKYLKHVERTKILLLVIDISIYADLPSQEVYKKIMVEINQFGSSLQKKELFIAANKTDLDPEKNEFIKFCNSLPDMKDRIFPISAATKKGIEDLKNALVRVLYS